MQILRAKISVAELRDMAQERFGDMVKAVVDARRRLIAVDGELHADQEALLLQDGSKQADLWGINLYPDVAQTSPDFIEFDSMINLRPSSNNRTRGVDDEETRSRIVSIVNEWIS
jgi:hypothetical protein